MPQFLAEKSSDRRARVAWMLKFWGATMFQAGTLLDPPSLPILNFSGA